MHVSPLYRKAVILLYCMILMCVGRSSNAAELTDPVISYPRLSCKLTGDELIFEAAVSQKTNIVPGIYAISKDSNKPRIVVPYGRRPRWAPNRKGFLFLYGHALLYADISSKVVVVPYDDYIDYNAHSVSFWWLPDSSGFVTLCADSFAGYVPVVFPPTGTPYMLGNTKKNISSISISSDRKFFVCDETVLIPGFGNVNPTIRVGQIGSHEMYSINDPRLANLVCFNAQWQPNGPLVVFDTYNPDNFQYSPFIWNHETSTLTPINIGKRLEEDAGSEPHLVERSYGNSYRIIEWSPDGTSLLVLPKERTILRSADSYALLVVSLNTDKPVISVGSWSAPLYAARWSPGGDMIATLRGDELDPMFSRLISLEIHGISKEEGRVISLPKHMIPVDIDW